MRRAIREERGSAAGREGRKEGWREDVPLGGDKPGRGRHLFRLHPLVEVRERVTDFLLGRGQL